MSLLQPGHFHSECGKEIYFMMIAFIADAHCDGIYINGLFKFIQMRMASSSHTTRFLFMSFRPCSAQFDTKSNGKYTISTSIDSHLLWLLVLSVSLTATRNGRKIMSRICCYNFPLDSNASQFIRNGSMGETKETAFGNHCSLSNALALD